MMRVARKCRSVKWHSVTLHGVTWQNLKSKRVPRNVMIRALVTKELAEKLEALAQREQRSLSAMIAILLQWAVEEDR